MKRIPLEFAAMLLLIVFIGCGNGTGEKSGAKSDKVDPSEEATEKYGEMVGIDGSGEAVIVTETEEAVPLVYRFRDGDTFGYSIDIIENVNILQDTIKNLNVQHTMFNYKFEVLEAFAGGGGRLRATMTRVLFEGTYSGPDGHKEMTYDSDKENSYKIEKLYARYNAPVNTPFELIIESGGRISEVTNLEEVIKRYLRDDYNKTEKAGREAVARDYSEAGIKQIIQLAFQMLPDHAVNVDSVWTISQAGQLGYLSMKNDAEYKFLGLSDSPSGKHAHMGVAITSTYTGDKKMDTGQGMATIETFDISGTGRTVLDLERGIPFGRKLRTDVHVRMFIEPPDELKELTQIENFWTVTKAFTENTVKRIQV